MLSADRSLKKINLGFPQQQNSICFHVRSNGISEGHIDFIQISEKITAGQIHQRCQNTRAQVSEPRSCALVLGTEGALDLRARAAPMGSETRRSFG